MRPIPEEPAASPSSPDRSGMAKKNPDALWIDRLDRPKSPTRHEPEKKNTPVSSAELAKLLRDIRNIKVIKWTEDEMEWLSIMIDYLLQCIDGTIVPQGPPQETLHRMFCSVIEKINAVASSAYQHPLEDILKYITVCYEPLRFKITPSLFAWFEELLTVLENCNEAINSILEGFESCQKAYIAGYLDLAEFHLEKTLPFLHGFYLTGTYSQKLLEAKVVAEMRKDEDDGKRYYAKLRLLTGLISGCYKKLMPLEEESLSSDYENQKNIAIEDLFSLIIMFGEEIILLAGRCSGGVKDGPSEHTFLCDLVKNIMKLQDDCKLKISIEAKRKMLKLLADVSSSGALGVLISKESNYYLPVSRIFMEAFRSNCKSLSTVSESCSVAGEDEERHKSKAVCEMLLAADGIINLEGTTQIPCFSSRRGSFARRVGGVFFDPTSFRHQRREHLCELVESMIELMELQRHDGLTLLEAPCGMMTEQVDKALDKLFELNFDTSKGVPRVRTVLEKVGEHNERIESSTSKQLEDLRCLCKAKEHERVCILS